MMEHRAALVGAYSVGLCWLFQLYSRSIKDRYAVPQKYKEIFSSTVLLKKIMCLLFLK